MKESQNNYMKIEDGLSSMREENLSLCKELAKSLQDDFAMAGDSIENEFSKWNTSIHLFPSLNPKPVVAKLLNMDMRFL